MASKRTAIVLGGSGSVGAALLRELFHDDAFDVVITLSRRSLPEAVGMARSANRGLVEKLVPEMTPASLAAATLDAARDADGELEGFSVLGVGANTAKLTLEEHRAVELIPAAGGGAIAGVLMIDMRSGELVLVRARSVLLATGGGPTMYRYHTPSGDKSCDGLAMALRAGLTLRDMEMVQFHPTGLLAGPGTRMTGTVLEEGLRGAGGYLLDGARERFMHKYDPRNERATRDIVSRAIFAEMRAGRSTPNGGVYLSMGHLGPEEVRRQFRGLVVRCADFGFDTRRPPRRAVSRFPPEQRRGGTARRSTQHASITHPRERSQQYRLRSLSRLRTFLPHQ
jgi:hypothetical protein